MDKKPLRVAAIIETTEGVLMVQDAKDKYRDFYLTKIAEKAARAGGKKRNHQVKRMEYACRIIKDGRFSLPGGKIEPGDYEEAGATSIMNLEKPQTPEQIELFLLVVREAIAREINEELGLGVDQDMVKDIMEIKGRTRDHIICLVHAEGIIKLNKIELSGIGLLRVRPVIPMNEFFYQAHLRTVHSKYIQSRERPEYVTRYLSKLNVSEHLVMDAYADEKAGYQYAVLGAHRRTRDCVEAHKPQSSPNFMIYDDKRNLYDPHQPVSFTESQTARIVPPNPERRGSFKKKSDPLLKAVREPQHKSMVFTSDNEPDSETTPRIAELPSNAHAPTDASVPDSRSFVRKTATDALRETLENLPATPKVGKK